MEKEKTENRLSIGRINGVDIYAVTDENNNVFVPVKPICDAIGIAYERQYSKLKEHLILSSVVTLRVTTGADGKNYEMVCIPQEFIYGWIFTINPKNVSENAREKVVKYQLECYKALYAYFHGQTKRLQEFVNIERELMARRETLQASLSEHLKSMDTIKSEIKDIDKKFNDLKSERLNPTPSLFD